MTWAVRYRMIPVTRILTPRITRWIRNPGPIKNTLPKSIFLLWHPPIGRLKRKKTLEPSITQIPVLYDSAAPPSLFPR